MALLVVAAVSARVLAEAACLDGHEVLALDLFGDRDTRAASSQWQAIGLPGSLRIDAEQLLGALRLAARRGALGWIAGSGFDGQPELLTQGASVLPLLGTAGDAVAAVRDPRRFFEGLRSDGIAHPPVRHRRPVPQDGWLLKDAGGSGGWHVRAAGPDDPDPPLPGRYWQQQARGLPMSMTLLADGQRALVLGINSQLIEPHGGHAFVFTGVLGPVPAPERMRLTLQGVAERLTRRFRLRGVCGVDFLCHGDELVVLEVNPRPPASAALYAPRGGLINAHLAACLQGHLPSGEAWASLRGDGRVRGLRYVFARSRLVLDAARLARLAARPGVHDVPQEPLRLAAGEPLCSVSDSGDDVPTLQASLARAGERLLNDLENP